MAHAASIRMSIYKAARKQLQHVLPENVKLSEEAWKNLCLVNEQQNRAQFYNKRAIQWKLWGVNSSGNSRQVHNEARAKLTCS